MDDFLKLPKDNYLRPYYNDIVKRIISGELKPFNTLRPRSEYTFGHHMREILVYETDFLQDPSTGEWAPEIEPQPKCVHCWSFVHKSESHMGGLKRYNDCQTTMRFLPVIDLK